MHCRTLIAGVVGSTVMTGLAACSPPPPGGSEIFRDPVAPRTCLVNVGNPTASIRYDGPATAWGNASVVETPAQPADCAAAPLASTEDVTLVKETSASRAKALCVLLAPEDLSLEPGVTTDDAIRADAMNGVGFPSAPVDAYVCQVNRFGL
jgi:hypothetical protein